MSTVSASSAADPAPEAAESSSWRCQSPNQRWRARLLIYGSTAQARKSNVAVASAPDPDQLLVDELVHAVAAELAAEARALDAAERQLGAVRADDVDEHHPRLDLLRDPDRLVLVRRHDVRAEAVGGVVRERDGLLLVLGAVDLRDGAEELLVARGVVRADVGEDGGLEEVALVLAARDELGALVERALELLG